MHRKLPGNKTETDQIQEEESGNLSNSTKIE